MIRVMIVDDQEMIRTGLTTIISASAELEVVAQAHDGLMALNALESTAVDVILMDLRMPGLDGVESIKRIRERYSAGSPRILVLTTFDQDENVINALRAGANGFLSKGASPIELTEGILRVAEGGKALSPTAVDAVVEHVAEQRRVPPDPEISERFDELTPREREIVGAIVSGLDNAAIAQQLYLSPFTVKTHVNHAMMKVGAKDRGQLVSLAVRAGILP